jgi:hypothetical protein
MRTMRIMRKSRSQRGRRSSQAPHRWLITIALSLTLWISSASLAQADSYDPTMSGHPLRIIAYVLHPVGVVLDYLIMRPAHWVGSQEPVKTLVGHED